MMKKSILILIERYLEAVAMLSKRLAKERPSIVPPIPPLNKPLTQE